MQLASIIDVEYHFLKEAFIVEVNDPILFT